MIDFDGETYLTVGEVAKRFQLSRATCYNNLLQQMQKYYLPGRKLAHYRLSDVEQLATIRVEQARRPLPALLTTAETRNGVTSGSTQVPHALSRHRPPHQPLSNSGSNSHPTGKEERAHGVHTRPSS